MIKFPDWCNETEEVVSTHKLRRLVAEKVKLAQVVDTLAEAVPDQIVEFLAVDRDRQRLAHAQVLQRVGGQRLAGVVGDELVGAGAEAGLQQQHAQPRR